MFDIKVFTNFRAPARVSDKDRRFLEILRKIRDTTKARFVNFTVWNYRTENPDSTHFVTYPMDWVMHYVRESYFSVDPLLAIDYRRVSHVDWSEVFVDDSQEEMLGKLSEFGIGNHAITVAGHIEGTSYAALALIYQCEPLRWSRIKSVRMPDFRQMAELAASRYRKLYCASEPVRRPLTDREREVLELAALGYTDNTIARCMGIGKWTVVGHMQSVKYKLACANRTAAVAKALALKLISLNLAG